MIFNLAEFSTEWFSIKLNSILDDFNLAELSNWMIFNLAELPSAYWITFNLAEPWTGWYSTYAFWMIFNLTAYWMAFKLA